MYIFGIPRVHRLTLCIWFPHNMSTWHALPYLRLKHAVFVSCVSCDVNAQTDIIVCVPSMMNPATWRITKRQTTHVSKRGWSVFDKAQMRQQLKRKAYPSSVSVGWMWSSILNGSWTPKIFFLLVSSGIPSWSYFRGENHRIIAKHFPNKVGRKKRMAERDVCKDLWMARGRWQQIQTRNGYYFSQNV